MTKFNTVTLSRSDHSVIGYTYDPTIKNHGDHRDQVAEMFFKKLKETESLTDKPARD